MRRQKHAATQLTKVDRTQMAKRPHISELFTTKTVLKIVLIPAIMAIIFLTIPIPDNLASIIGVVFAMYMYGVVRDKVVISDYGPKPPDEVKGEPLQDQVNNGESHDGRK
ncbi:hypothetical protein [Ciceribacter sp. RN22]|uniref:hypothetical protein n=1 Tax=Ciceribacter sp. RN22 TaxID=2954932 RepID=UPI002092A7C5|nr:hypothetical protein [Ciceribacter sp. RN22]MCO6178439.1 hypothetical protein [Ciceribacter sp. RN22]